MSSVIAVSFFLFIIVVVTRFMPFWFQGLLKDNKQLARVGRRLPALIISLLVIFELDPKSFLIYPYGLPSLIALLILVVIHLWQRQVLLSMLAGLASYLLVLPYFH